VKKIALSLTLFALVLAVIPVPAQACTVPSADAWLIIHNSSTAWLIFHRLTLVNNFVNDVGVIEDMDVCTIGLNLFPGVLEISAASLTDSRTHKPIESLLFQKSTRATELFQRVSPQFGKGVPGLAPVTRWQGFVGRVDGSLREGQQVDLMFTLKLDPRVPLERLIRALNSQGAYSAGAVSRQFTPINGHFGVQRPHDINIMFQP
jgi:hypothetical protein